MEEKPTAWWARQAELVRTNDVSRRRRKKQRARGRRKRPGGAPRGEASEKQRKSEASKGAAANRSGTAEKPQAEWVMMEHRDADGNPTVSKKLIRSTYRRRYNQVPPGTEIEAHVLAGYRPPVMMIERKIYEIHRLSVGGWRRTGRIAVEVGGWRGHESHWFEAMKGAKLRISDPGLGGPHNDEADYIVSESSFDRKIVTQLDEQGGESEIKLHHGTLDLTETWRSTWRRQRAGVLSLGFKLLFAPLFAAIGAGLTLLWVDRPALPDSGDSDSLETPVQSEDQATDGAAGDEPLGPDSNDQMPVVLPTQTESDSLLESSDSAKEDSVGRRFQS